MKHNCITFSPFCFLPFPSEVLSFKVFQCTLSFSNWWPFFFEYYCHIHLSIYEQIHKDTNTTCWVSFVICVSIVSVFDNHLEGSFSERLIPFPRWSLVSCSSYLYSSNSVNSCLFQSKYPGTLLQSFCPLFCDVPLCCKCRIPDIDASSEVALPWHISPFSLSHCGFL